MAERYKDAEGASYTLADLRAIADWLATTPAPRDPSEPDFAEWDDHWDQFFAIVTPIWVLNVLDVVEAAKACDCHGVGVYGASNQEADRLHAALAALEENDG